VTGQERSDWVDACWSALKIHTGWRDDGSKESGKASDKLRHWVNRQPTMPLGQLLELFGKEHGR
jgi:hypothetical protein